LGEKRTVFTVEPSNARSQISSTHEGISTRVKRRHIEKAVLGITFNCDSGKNSTIGNAEFGHAISSLAMTGIVIGSLETKENEDIADP